MSSERRWCHNGVEAERLWRAWAAHDDLAARNRLVLSFAPLVKYLAGRKVRDLPPHCDLDDLISAGLIALIAACDRWNPTKGASFEHFAWTRIEGAILDELRRADWAPRGLRQRAKAIARAEADWQARTGRDPTPDELARAVGAATTALRNDLAELDRATIVYLDAVPLNADDSDARTTLGGRVASRAPSPELSVIAQERSSEFRRAFGRLTARERLIVDLVDGQGIRCALVGEHLGVSESRVSQIHTTARTKLLRALDQYDRNANHSRAAL